LRPTLLCTGHRGVTGDGRSKLDMFDGFKKSTSDADIEARIARHCESTASIR